MKVNYELFLVNPINIMWDRLRHGSKHRQSKREGGKSPAEIEKELNPHNVAYKIKDKPEGCIIYKL